MNGRIDPPGVTTWPIEHRDRLAEVMFRAMIGVDEKTRLAVADAILKYATVTWKPNV